MQLEEFRRKKAAAAAAKQQAAGGAGHAAARPLSAFQTPTASLLKPSAPHTVRPAQPASSPAKQPAASPAAVASPTAAEPARPPSAPQQAVGPAAHGGAVASGSHVADTTGRENGAATQAEPHAAAAAQTLAVNPLFSEEHEAEDGWGKQSAGGATGSPQLLKLQRAYGKQVSIQITCNIAAWCSRHSAINDLAHANDHDTVSHLLQMAENEDLQEQIEDLTRQLQQQDSRHSEQLQAVRYNADEQAAALTAAHQDHQRQQDADAAALQAAQAEARQAAEALEQERQERVAAAQRAAEQDAELAAVQAELVAAREKQEADARQAAESQQELQSRLAAAEAAASATAAANDSAGAEQLAEAANGRSEAEAAAQQAREALERAEAQLWEQQEQLAALQQQQVGSCAPADCQCSAAICKWLSVYTHCTMPICVSSHP